MEVTVAQFKQFLINIVDMIEEQKDYLCELDRKLGDGDHGITMSIGWQAIKEQLEGPLAEEEDCVKVSSTAGRTFLSAVGSSVGPLYATGFMRGAKAIKGKEILNDEVWKNFWVAFVDGIQERGQAELGDKTMMDALIPARETLITEFNKEADFVVAFEKAVIAAKEGAESTKGLLSKRGRSSRLGERSIGVQDPGATSASLILEQFLYTVQNAVRVN